MGIDTMQRATDRATARSRLLDGLPVQQRRRELANTPTALLEGGDGPPLVLLHGPGEAAPNWLRVIPQLAAHHRVIAPDLPGHGASGLHDGALDADYLIDWLGELIERTCATPPLLVGHVLGGAIAARFAAACPDAPARLVLVDSLGLAPFRPRPRFAITMAGFLARPTERSYERFMRQCSYDLDGLRDGMGDCWQPFAAYNLQLARSPSAKAAGRMMRAVGVRPIPPAQLARITAPTSLIWGRDDRAIRLQVAEAASARYGWPLHVVDDCADDPARDRPDAFLRALDAAERE